MAGLFKRTLVVSAGVLLGMAVVAGAVPLGHLLSKRASPPAPPLVPGEHLPAPDTRV